MRGPRGEKGAFASNPYTQTLPSVVSESGELGGPGSRDHKGWRNFRGEGESVSAVRGTRAQRHAPTPPAGPLHTWSLLRVKYTSAKVCLDHHSLS